MASNPKTILGLDAGQKWVGIARASTAARLAEPLISVKTSEAEAELKKLIDETAVAGIVVGLPRNLEGHDTDQTNWTRQWAKQLQDELTVPFHFIDEALTSQGTDHAGAAARLLQDWLDSELTAKADDGKVL